MTANDFSAWVAHMYFTQGWNKHECADARVAVGTASPCGARGAPRYIGLACAAIAAGLEEWHA